MTFEEKYNFAMQELRGTPLWKSHYNPLFIRLAYKLGFKSRPPYYNSFLNNALSSGIFFCTFWGLFMYAFVWQGQDISQQRVGFAVLFAGTFVGLSMASYYKYGFKKYKLTPWSEIKNIQ